LPASPENLGFARGGEPEANCAREVKGDEAISLRLSACWAVSDRSVAIWNDVAADGAPLRASIGEL